MSGFIIWMYGLKYGMNIRSVVIVECPPWSEYVNCYHYHLCSDMHVLVSV
jgi:hypothetical protein